MSYNAGNYTFIVMFDPKTGLPARVRTLDYDNVWGDVNYDLVLSDWRTMGGVRIAASQKYELNGRVMTGRQDHGRQHQRPASRPAPSSRRRR